MSRCDLHGKLRDGEPRGKMALRSRSVRLITEQDEINNTHGSRAPLGLGVNYILMSIALLMVGCRMLVKGKLGKLGIEDALILISMSCIITLVVMTKFSTHYGFGMHIADVRPEWWPVYAKYSYTYTALGCVPYPLTKVSMLCFYLRLTQQPAYRKICYATIGYILVSAFGMLLANTVTCTPLRGGWDKSPELGVKCADTSAYLYFYMSMNVVTDAMLVLLPIPILLRLQIHSKTKYGLVAMFACGISITAVSGYSVYTVNRAYNSPDVMWNGSYSWLWALGEFQSGIIVACMPSTLLFIKWVRGDMSGSNNSGSGSGRTPGQNLTIGSGGRAGAGAGTGAGTGGSSRAKKYSQHGGQTEMTTRTSIRLGSQEHIMQDVDGIVKSTEVTVVEMAMPMASREHSTSSMC